MEELTGISAERALGGTRRSTCPPASAEPGVVQLLEAGARRARPCPPGTSSSRSRKPARSGWVVGTYGPHRNAAGEIVGVIGIIRNVTERRRNEQALRESEERFRRMADAAPVMIWMDDADGHVHLLQQALARLHRDGRSQQELGRGSRDGIHPDDLVPRFIAVYDAAFTARRGVPDRVPAAPRRRRVPLGPRDGDAAVHRVRASSRATSARPSTSPSGGRPSRCCARSGGSCGR